MESDGKKLLFENKSEIQKDEKLYNDILTYNNNFSVKLKWSNLLYLYCNNIKDLPLCYCGNELKFLSPKQGYRTFCSTRCMYDSKEIKEKRIKTNIEKYGVKNPSMSKEIRKKIEETNIKKYGERYPLMNNEVLEKNKKYFKDVYGVDNPSKVKKFNLKREETMLKRYGVNSYPKTEEFIKKTKSIKLENHGDENFNNRIKFKETMLERYGSTSYNNIEKIKSTNMDKYGKEFYTQTTLYKKKIDKIINKKNIEYFENYNISFIKYISSDEVVLKCNKCGNEYNTTKQLFRKRVTNLEETCLHCNPISYQVSKSENEIKEYLNSIGIKINENDRSLLHNKEIDIYIPDYKLGIEFNGLYWHSDLFKEKNYHYNKMIECGKNNIKLLQIWEDQWLYKKDIVKSMILNKLNKTPNKIYARKCVLREVNYNESKKFLDDNHLQGYCNSKLRYGLYYKDELVSLMTFGKLRINLGQKNKSNNKEIKYELLRFCNKLNYSVVGSFSKLLKHFQRNNTWDEIISYAMCDYSNGDIYEKMNFQKLYHTGPNYYYFKDKVRHNRYKFRKDVLVREGYDKNLTEKEIMFNRGFNRIYDSGSIKYTMSIPKPHLSLPLEKT